MLVLPVTSNATGAEFTGGGTGGTLEVSGVELPPPPQAQSAAVITSRQNFEPADMAGLPSNMSLPKMIGVLRSILMIDDFSRLIQFTFSGDEWE
jgi:hypothetical protein